MIPSVRLYPLNGPTISRSYVLGHFLAVLKMKRFRVRVDCRMMPGVGGVVPGGHVCTEKLKKSVAALSDGTLTILVKETVSRGETVRNDPVSAGQPVERRPRVFYGYGSGPMR